jgi:hypothetical protein
VDAAPRDEEALMDIIAVRAAAQRQVDEEQFAAAVAREVTRIKTKVPLWHRLFPFVITRRSK